MELQPKKKKKQAVTKWSWYLGTVSEQQQIGYERSSYDYEHTRWLHVVRTMEEDIQDVGDFILLLSVRFTSFNLNKHVNQQPKCKNQ